MRHIRFRDPAGALREGEHHGDHVSFGGRDYPLDEVEILPASDPSKIICVGRNYAKHAAERGEDVPDRPLLFLKPPSTVAGHGDTVTLPAGKERVEHEVELGVVISEQCRNVAAEDAEDVIAGYTVAIDVSNRDDQRVEQNWVRGKAFDGSCPLGPVVADPEHVPENADISLRVNGEVRQSSNTEHFIFSVPELVEEITQYMTLEAGDVVITGTPEGVGPLENGDHVEADVEGVGTLEVDVEQ